MGNSSPSHEWNKQVEALFSTVFLSESVLILFLCIRRLWAYNGPQYDFGAAIIMSIGLVFPTLFYIPYFLIRFSFLIYKHNSLIGAAKSILELSWLYRSIICFSLSLFVSAILYPFVALVQPLII